MIDLRDEKKKQVADYLSNYLGSYICRSGSGPVVLPSFYDPSFLSKARKVTGMTQVEFGEWVGGFHASTVGRWERGECFAGLDARRCLKQKIEKLNQQQEREAG